MTKLQRIKEIAIALIMIFGAIVMMSYPKESYPLIVIILALWFIAKGISSIWYYLTMARFMVGGRESLFMGVIWFDFGVLTGSLTSVPHYYVLLYLIGIHGFSGVVRVLRTLETRRTGSPNWKLKLAHGIIDIAMALLCIVLIKQLNITAIIFGIGVLYSAVMRIVTACRRTALIVIE